MSEKNKNILYIVIGAVVLIAIVIVAIVISKKKASAATLTGATTTGTTPVCNKYTQDMYNRDLAAIRSKCYSKLLIPVVGIGYYNTCVTQGKAGLPFIGSCI